MPFLRQYLRVFKLLLNCLSPWPSFAHELGLSWVKVLFMNYPLPPAFTELRCRPVRVALCLGSGGEMVLQGISKTPTHLSAVLCSVTPFSIFI